jgi:hypothetical protein
MYIFEKFREANYNYRRNGYVDLNFRGDTCGEWNSKGRN